MHAICTVDGPYRQPSSELGAGFTYWSIRHPTAGLVGHLRTPEAAGRIVAAYADPRATLESVRAAWDAEDVRAGVTR